MENVADPLIYQLNKNQIEFVLKDDFLPIYTNDQYAKVFKEQSIAMDVTSRKSFNSFQSKQQRSNMSPFSTSKSSKF